MFGCVFALGTESGSREPATKLDRLVSHGGRGWLTAFQPAVVFDLRLEIF